MRHRKLRITWSALCGMLCLVLTIVTLRSYHWADALLPRFSRPTVLSRGQIFVEADCAWQDPHLRTFAVDRANRDIQILDIYTPTIKSLDLANEKWRLPLWPAQ